jgi:hypothetical protein
MIECLVCKHKTLSSNPSSTKNRCGGSQRLDALAFHLVGAWTVEVQVLKSVLVSGIGTQDLGVRRFWMGALHLFYT